jgi:hypothetical protein
MNRRNEVVSEYYYCKECDKGYTEELLKTNEEDIL